MPGESMVDAATHLEHLGIKNWKANGGSILGYICSYVPVELLHAAGILPVRLRGIETDGMDIGDAYFGPYICSFPKCILQLAGQGRFSFLDGTIITPGCDSMRRLDECWRKAGEDYENILSPFFHYFDVPHKTVSHRMEWFIDEIHALKSAIEEFFGAAISNESLKNSIEIYNRGRTLLGQLEQLRAQQPGLVTGVEAFSASIAGTVMPREDYIQELEQLLEQAKNRDPKSDTNPVRLMLVGSISDDIDLVELIESKGKAVVVADNLCFGIRHNDRIIDTGPDPIRSLAEKYLVESTCPRMFGQYKSRLGILMEKIATAGVDGVILQNIRFCDLHGSENGLFERDLEREGIPCLKLEREYGPLIETGRIRMRIEAFLERLSR